MHGCVETFRKYDYKNEVASKLITNWCTKRFPGVPSLKVNNSEIHFAQLLAKCLRHQGAFDNWLLQHCFMDTVALWRFASPPPHVNRLFSLSHLSLGKWLVVLGWENPVRNWNQLGLNGIVISYHPYHSIKSNWCHCAPDCSTAHSATSCTHDYRGKYSK